MNQYNTYVVLDRLRKRPGMYIGSETLENLQTYLMGYWMAMDDLEASDFAIPPFHSFHEWVGNKYGYREGRFGWGNLDKILAISLGDNPDQISSEGYGNDLTNMQHKKSIELFYKLLDEYRSSSDT